MSGAAPPAWGAIAVGLALPLGFWLFRWLQWPFWALGSLLVPLVFLRNVHSRWLGIAGALLGAYALFSQSNLPVKLYPVLINLALLLVFSLSLLRGPSAIERLARLSDPELPPQAITYTRKVTIAWCMFFVLNGALAFATVLHPDERVWALYNGLIAYLLMGLMFAGEWLLRQRVMRGG